MPDPHAGDPTRSERRTRRTVLRPVHRSGLSTTRFVRWFDARYGEEVRKREWVPLHLCCGVKTNIVIAVEVTDRHGADAPYLPLLVANTATHFQMEQVSADKAYSSRRIPGLWSGAGGLAH